MRTQLPISTISYNTKEYLKIVLDSMIAAEEIDFWAFIIHKPDIDDMKEHNHIYMRPARIIDTEKIRNHFIEPDFEIGIPRKALMIRKSNSFGDWYLYGMHDREYLKCKGMERNVHYGEADFICSDKDSFRMLANEIDVVALRGFVNMIEAAAKGRSLYESLEKGIIPVSRAGQWTHIYSAIQKERKVYGS